MKRIIISTIALTILGLGTTACEGLDSSGTAADRAAHSDKQDKKQDKPADVKEGPQGTPGQEQALGSANDYLDYSAFSEKGLIEQLEFEDFSKADAVWAVNHVKTNWNNQAALSAKEYLDNSHFSRQGLIEQLEFEGFTPTQAAYGANHAGL